MYQNSPEAEVPAPFEALMVLSKTASQMGPAGPTVASQLMQRVQRPPMAPPGMPPQGPPQGPPGMMPGDPFRQQMMATLGQQAQQSAQPPQPPGPPQGPPPGMPPQGMAQGGIASLRAPNMRFSHGGGVLHFVEGGDTPAWENLPTAGFGVSVPPDFDIDWNNPNSVRAMQRAMRDPSIPAAERQAIAQRLEVLGLQDPQSLMQRYQELVKKRSELEGKISSQTPPVEYTRDMMKEELKQQFPVSPFEAQRAGIADLLKQQQQIMARRQEAYEQEKAGRESERFGAVVRGIAERGLGGAGIGSANFEQAIRAREEGFTGQLEKDQEFRKGLLALSNAANTAEYNDAKENLLGKITDYRQARALFDKDQSSLMESLRKEEGNILNAFAKMYIAENKPAARATNQNDYATAYVQSKQAAGDTRPEPVIREEGIREFLKQQQVPQVARVDVASEKEVGDRLQEARKEVAEKLSFKSLSSPGNATLRKRVMSARSDPQAMKAIEDELLREALKSRGVPEKYWPAVSAVSPTVTPSGTNAAPPGYDPSKVRLKGP